MNKNQVKEEVKKLISKYEQVKTSGKIKNYTEEETKKDFILPLFRILGWEVEDKNEVSAEEDNISSGRVDYGFYINGRAKFYLEAKPLKADINREEYANQAVRYSWNKGITWAILTDFETLKVFNAQDISKDLGDKQYFSIDYFEYIDRFDQLWLLSKESLKEDLIDKEAEKIGKKLQRVPISELLYKDLNECRRILTDYLGKWNSEVSKDLLDEGVQKLLDRLIFIRVAEDRKIEPNILAPLINKWRILTGSDKPRLYESMARKFRELDSIYNSNLFSSHPFEKWEDDGGGLEKVISILYGKKGYYEYDFSVMPADVLGSVYENYLGYKLSQSQKGLTLDKTSSKRKEQGIYYTPVFIVDYIVRNALKPVLDNCKSVNDLKKIKVLDPACGSGSFLIKALVVILEKYKEFNYEDTENLRIQIILENIYGVDLDEQAVEIARLNLLINALEERGKLPSLENNIKNGNSLISGTDEELEKHFGKNFRDKKPFNWEEEFPEVFKQGGFDVIIGNPPYIKEDANRSAFDGLHDSPYYQGKMDIWTLFACRAIDILKDTGYFSFIAPSSWIASAGASIFRGKILSEGEIVKFIDFSDFRVFKDASIQTMIFVFEKKKPRKLYKVGYAKITNKDAENNSVAQLLFSDLKERDNNSIVFEATLNPLGIESKPISFSNDTVSEVLDKITNKGNFKLSKDDIGNGIDVLQDFVSGKHLEKLNDGTIKKGEGVFVLENSFVEKMKVNDLERAYLKPYYTTMQINRYLSQRENKYKIIYADKYFREHINEFPNLKVHIDRFKKILTSAFAPYGLHRVREERFFEGKAIFLLRKTMYPAFTYVDFPCYVTRAFLVLKPEKIDLKYLTGLLNSKLIYFWLKNKGKKQGEQLQIDKEPLMDIPLFKVSETEQERISIMVDTIMSRKIELQKTSENSNKFHSIKIEIERLERKIDEEVYKSYGLTLEEIKIVESS